MSSSAEARGAQGRPAASQSTGRGVQGLSLSFALAAGLALTYMTWREITLLNVFPGLVMSLVFWLAMRNVALRSVNIAERRIPQDGRIALTVAELDSDTKWSGVIVTSVMNESTLLRNAVTAARPCEPK